MKSEQLTTEKHRSVGATQLVLAVSIALLMFVILKNAWASDDSYITFRTVDNLLHGYGPVWNVSERVDTFTNPLWMLLLTSVSFILHGVNIYYVALLVSITCTLSAVLIFVRGVARTMWGAVLGVTFLATSKSFIDYATSGLEDSLSYLLLVAFMFVFLRSRNHLSRLFLLALIASLATFNRMDTILLYLPALLYAMYEAARTERHSGVRAHPPASSTVHADTQADAAFSTQPYAQPYTSSRALDAVTSTASTPQSSVSVRSVAPAFPRTFRSMAVWLGALLKVAGLTLLGFVPFIVWECFSLWYYGFLFPNTAYAKLDSGFPSSVLLQQGIGYFISSFQFDPVLFFVFFLGIALPMFTRDRTSALMALGIVLYLAYTARVGGDFMAGRFLSIPYVLSVMVISRMRVSTYNVYWFLFAVPIICAVVTPHSPWVADYSYATPSGPGGLVDVRGVADERMAYVMDTSLINFQRSAPGQSWPTDWTLGTQAKACGPGVVVYDRLGAFGYYAGPDVHIVDPLALSDPLLARLPASSSSRIGHFQRAIPLGYIQTLQTGVNQIADPNIALYYSKLQVVISGNLFDPNRLITIWKFNTGQYDYLIRDHPYQSDSTVQPFSGC